METTTTATTYRAVRRDEFGGVTYRVRRDTYAGAQADAFTMNREPGAGEWLVERTDVVTTVRQVD